MTGSANWFEAITRLKWAWPDHRHPLQKHLGCNLQSKLIILLQILQNTKELVLCPLLKACYYRWFIHLYSKRVLYLYPLSHMDGWTFFSGSTAVQYPPSLTWLIIIIIIIIKGNTIRHFCKLKCVGFRMNDLFVT